MEFSVLMAVYKNDIPNEVDNAICSVLNQTVSPTEIVIVVDGPVPQALDELLNSYSLNSKFIIVRLQENGGLGYGIAQVAVLVQVRFVDARNGISDSVDLCGELQYAMLYLL